MSKKLEVSQETKDKLVLGINSLIAELQLKHISDRHHTHEELYQFRKLYNACLFNEWAKTALYNVHKSEKHEDGEPCFGGGWFIVSAMLPTGLISNHYKLADWDLFQIPSVEKALFKFDGHTGFDVLDRLENLIRISKVEF